MFSSRIVGRLILVGAALLAVVANLPGQAPVTKTANDVNKKMVKLFGAGGFKGLPSYGTGILVSAKGHILTVNNHILSTADLRCIIGRELKNTLSDTWSNYAVPVQAKVEIQRGEKTESENVASFVKKAMAGTYIVGNKVDRAERAGYHGIILVHNAVQVTPPFVEEVVANSPAAKAGLRPDDLIVYIDGELVQSIRNFRSEER